jgi:hypothetical protein
MCAGTHSVDAVRPGKSLLGQIRNGAPACVASTGCGAAPARTSTIRYCSRNRPSCRTAPRHVSPHARGHASHTHRRGPVRGIIGQRCNRRAGRGAHPEDEDEELLAEPVEAHRLHDLRPEELICLDDEPVGRGGGGVLTARGRGWRLLRPTRRGRLARVRGLGTREQIRAAEDPVQTQRPCVRGRARYGVRRRKGGAHG